MRKLLVRPQVRVDLLEIWHFIARDSTRTADRVIAKLESAIRGLVEMPGKGHTRLDVKNPRYRFWSVYSYVVAYHHDEKALTVVRVVHGGRNFRALFRR